MSDANLFRLKEELVLDTIQTMQTTRNIFVEYLSLQGRILHVQPKNVILAMTDAPYAKMIGKREFWLQRRHTIDSKAMPIKLFSGQRDPAFVSYYTDLQLKEEYEAPRVDKRLLVRAIGDLQLFRIRVKQEASNLYPKQFEWEPQSGKLYIRPAADETLYALLVETAHLFLAFDGVAPGTWIDTKIMVADYHPQPNKNMATLAAYLVAVFYGTDFQVPTKDVDEAFVRYQLLAAGQLITMFGCIRRLALQMANAISCGLRIDQIRQEEKEKGKHDGRMDQK